MANDNHYVNNQLTTKPNGSNINRKIKLLAIGDVNTGKTSILRRYVYKEFDDDTQSTIGMDIATKHLKVNEIKWSIQIWDIAGQERFIGLTRTYYKNALAAVVVFDITQKKSLSNAKIWKDDVDDKVFLNNGNNIPCILLANKWDLITEQPKLRQFSDQDLDEFCKENNFLGWFSTSAKTGLNIKKSMQFLVGEAVNYILNSDNPSQANTVKTVDINNMNAANLSNTKSKCSCAVSRVGDKNDHTY